MDYTCRTPAHNANTHSRCQALSFISLVYPYGKVCVIVGHVIAATRVSPQRQGTQKKRELGSRFFKILAKHCVTYVALSVTSDLRLMEFQLSFPGEKAPSKPF